MEKLEPLLFGELSCWVVQAVFVLTFLIGFYHVLSSVLSLSKFQWRYNLSCWRTNQFLKYRKDDSFVVVTGGSDGIGLEICRKMAGENFNVCMVARSEEKMKEKIAILQHEFPCTVFKYVVADFAKLKTIQDYQTVIGDQVADIDIAMLFLNAGFIAIGALADQHPQDVEAQVEVNVLQVIYTAKVLLKQMIERRHPGAVVVTTGAAASVALPGLSLVSATKTFADYIGQGLYYELREHQIDSISWQANAVATKLSGQPAQGNCKSPEYAVKHALHDVGYMPMTDGCRAHKMSNWMMRTVMGSFAKQQMFKQMKKMHANLIEKGFARKAD